MRILISFKARAFLDLSERQAEGEKVDTGHTREHRGDMFRLVQLLPGEGSLAPTDSMQGELGEFSSHALREPACDYAALRLPLMLDDALAILGRYYRLNGSG